MRVSHQTRILLQAFLDAPAAEPYGFELSRATIEGRHLYPILQRCRGGWLTARWEDLDERAAGRRRRRYYRLTAEGEQSARAAVQPDERRYGTSCQGGRGEEAWIDTVRGGGLFRARNDSRGVRRGGFDSGDRGCGRAGRWWLLAIELDRSGGLFGTRIVRLASVIFPKRVRQEHADEWADHVLSAGEAGFRPVIAAIELAVVTAPRMALRLRVRPAAGRYILGCSWLLSRLCVRILMSEGGEARSRWSRRFFGFPHSSQRR